MNALEIVSVQALESQAFALAARLHVILRREKGRITDIEYMQRDAAYCRHVLGLVDVQESDDMRALCTKLEELYLGPHGIFIRQAPPTPKVLAEPEPVPSMPAKRVTTKKDYIGRLR